MCVATTPCQARVPMPATVRVPVAQCLADVLGVDAATQASERSPTLYLRHSMPSDRAHCGLQLHGPTVMPERQSRCELEVDVWSEDIVNVKLGLPHLQGSGRDGGKTAQSGGAVRGLPSLMALWEVC